MITIHEWWYLSDLNQSYILHCSNCWEIFIFNYQVTNLQMQGHLIWGSWGQLGPNNWLAVQGPYSQSPRNFVTMQIFFQAASEQ
jgi:hypothetical protein